MVMRSRRRQQQSTEVPGEFLFLCVRRDFAANYCNKNLSIRDIT
jgi:hypothetical protein